jgi:death on curing protein
VRYLTTGEVLDMYRDILRESGGALGVRDLGAVESAVAQPRMTFDQTELYPTITDKAAALGFSLIENHPFVDGNKRVAHAALEMFLLLNGCEINASVDEQEWVILRVAAGQMRRPEFAEWLRTHSEQAEVPREESD